MDINANNESKFYESIDSIESKDLIIKNPMSSVAAMNLGEFYF